jgi:hypothetical protein
MWWRQCRLVGLSPSSLRHGTFGLLYFDMLEEGTQLLMGLPSSKVDGSGIV